LAEKATPQDDPFDIGDTGHQVEGDVPPQKKPEPKPTNVIDVRPRNPDGTFAPVTPPAEPAPPTSRHPAYLIEQAKSFGYTEEEIEDTPTHILGKTMHRLNQQALRFRDEQLRARQVSEGQVRAPQPAPAIEEDIELDWGTDEEGRPLAEKDFHPGVVKALKSLAKKQRDETKGLREELSKRDEREQQRENNRAAAVFDAAFASLGAEYEIAVGKGPGREMGQAQQDEYDNRIAILTKAQADPRVHTVAQVKAKVKAAAEKMFGKFLGKHPAPYAEVGKTPKQPAPPTNGVPKPRITPEEWEEAALARPTQRQSSEQKGEELAVKNLAARMDAETIPDSEELDGFPE